MQQRSATRVLELACLALSVGCRHPEGSEPKPRPSAAPSSPLTVGLLPRLASSFTCRGDVCRQQYPRVPDTGQWRCAERGQVVWCAGGEPAAGVVGGPADASFRCARRWGKGNTERVCIDELPDYPDAKRAGYACRFEQELGMARLCNATTPAPGRPLVAGAIAACWLDRDCPSGSCDRGSCACQSDLDCELGRCQAAVCVEVKP